MPYERSKGRFQRLLQTILSVPVGHNHIKTELGVLRTASLQDQKMPLNVLLLQSPTRRACQGQTVCGKQCLQQRGFKPEHLGRAAAG